MRKILLGAAALVAIATPLASASSATAAGTPRCQDSYVTSSTTTAEFDATEPAGAYDQWGNVWSHHYTVTVNPDGTFTGTGTVTGDDGTNVLDHVAETVLSGKFTDLPDDGTTLSDHVTYTGSRGGVTYTLTNSLGTDEIAVADFRFRPPSRSSSRSACPCSPPSPRTA